MGPGFLYSRHDQGSWWGVFKVTGTRSDGEELMFSECDLLWLKPDTGTITLHSYIRGMVLRVCHWLSKG